MLRSLSCLCLSLAADALLLPTLPSTPPRARAAVMREPDSRSKAREKLLPELFQALDDVALFVAKAYASRMRKPSAPTAESIEAYCAVQQQKVDLLLAEAKIMQDCVGRGRPAQVRLGGAAAGPAASQGRLRSATQPGT